MRSPVSPPGRQEPILTRLDILPRDRTVKPGDRQRLLVRATFSDNHAEDVTPRAAFSSNDIALATVSDAGQAHVLFTMT